MSHSRVNGRQMPENDSVPLDPGAEQDVRAFLQTWRDPEPDRVGQARLMAMLMAEAQATTMPRPTVARPTPIPFAAMRRALTAMHLILWSQVRVINRWLWVSSALVIALGAWVTVILNNGVTDTGALLPITIIAPIVAAFGVAFLYGTDADPAIELVLATPVSLRLIALARMVLVFGFNTAITLVLSAVLVGVRADLSLAALVIDWFAPMTLLSGLAFFLSVLFFDPLVSGLLSLCLWAAFVARSIDQRMGGNVLGFMPNLLGANLHAGMIIAGVGVFLLALARLHNEERWTNKEGFG